jgi:polyhydroxybutyrate depolymerase
MKLHAHFLYLLCATFFGNVYAACEQKTLPVRGIDRTGIVCAPTDMTVPVPVVLAFHGRGSSAEEMALGTHLHDAWPEALVVYLNGKTGNPAPYDHEGQRSGWQINPGDMNDRDVAFTDATLDALAQHYNIDSKRVFAVGHSNGARFVGILWSLRGHRIAALAFSAAQADTLIEAAEPRSVFMGMGIRDDVVSFDWQRRSIKYAAMRFGIKSSELKRTGISLTKNNDGIELVTFIHDGGHIWPAEQTRMIISFFKRQNLPLNSPVNRDAKKRSNVAPVTLSVKNQAATPSSTK